MAALFLICSPGLKAVIVLSDCSESGLRNALLQTDNFITFATNCSITLSAPIPIYTGTIKQIDAGGHTVTLSGNNAVSLFSVSGNLTLIGMTLVNGQNTSGGALYINPGSYVTATNCTFMGNSANGLNGPSGSNGADSANGNGGNGGDAGNGTAGLGGAIFNAGILNLLQCTLTNNTASGGNGGNGGSGGNGGGVLSQGGNGGLGGNGGPGFGGAVYNVSNLVVFNCTVAGNRASGGQAGTGGTNGAGALTSLAGSGGAGANGSGAGIYNAKNMNVQGCTFSFNSVQGGSSAAGGNQANGRGSTGARGADGTGGAIWSTWWGLLTNCTVYSNSATGGNGGTGGNGSGTLSTAGDGGDGGSGWGGGVFNAGTISVVNCTISSGLAIAGTNGAAGNGSFNGNPGQMGQALGGNIASSAGTFNLLNSILTASLSGNNGYGAITDLGHDLSSDASIPLTGTGSAVSIDPKLGPLAMNGGPTATMMPQAGSPAINRIPSTAASNIDQRGYPRPVPLGGLSDIGAVEYELASAPLIVQFPASRTNIQGGSVTFTIRAIGATPLGYQWHLDGTNIPGATQSTYTISNISTTNAGAGNFYDVKVSNSVPPSTNSGAVYAYLAPSILTQPVAQAVPIGSNATFTVLAAGDPTLLYQWQLNGADVAGATDASYSITNAQVSDGGVYQVFVVNQSGTTNSAAVKFGLLPTILVPPADQAAPLGGSATFSVQADGSSPLHYQWQFYSTNLPGATATNLTLSNVQGANAGVYSVIITNVFGSTNSTAQLDVPPQIVSQPTNRAVNVGATAIFTVGALGSIPLNYQWQFNGTNLASQTTSSLALTSVQLANMGNYLVVVTNSQGAATSVTASLNLLPTILGQPTNLTVTAGNPATFNVAATGSPTLTYQWRLNGANVTGATASTYSIPAVQTPNLGTYTVFITNLFGSITSAPATLSFGLAPSITAQPDGPPVSAGQTAVLTVTAAGSAPLSYQWLWSGTNLLGATGASLSISNAQLSNAGPYNVLVTNSFGSSLSADATVKLLPTITTQPTNQLVTDNAPFTFTVNATGTAPLAYQWRLYGTNLAGAATNSSYFVANAHTNNAGPYTAVIANNFGSVTSATAALTLGAAPSIGTQPTNQIVRAGSNATFFVTASGTAPLGYQWQFNSNNIANATASSFTITNAQPADVGSYSVIVTNALGSIVSTNATLNLKPNIFTNPVSQVVAAGSTASFSVVAAGSPNLTYQWWFNGSNAVGTASPVYTVTNAQANNIGTYTVVIANNYGSITSAPVTLNLLPTILSQPASLIVLVGSNATFRVQATGSPILKYQWRFNGANIAAATNSQFVLANPRLTNSGNYSVTVTNAFGQTNSSAAKLTVVAPYSITGQVLAPDGSNGLSGVTVTGGTNSTITVTTTTDTSGFYAFSGLLSGTYTITPSSGCYQFNPTNATVTVGGGTVLANTNFTASPYVVAGNISNSAGGPSTNTFTVFLVSGTNTTASTESVNGVFGFTNLCAGTYVVQPSSGTYIFSPPYLTSIVPPGDTGLSFVATPVFTISGQITNALGPVQVDIIQGTNTYTTTSDVTGNYSLGGLTAGSYSVVPEPVRCHHFQPASRPVTIGPDATGVNFAPVPDAYVIAGQVVNGAAGVSNVTVTLSGNGQTASMITGVTGQFGFSNLCAGPYTQTVATADCFLLTPLSQTVIVGPTNALNVIVSAMPNVYSVSGSITAGAAGVGGVILQLSGLTNSARTDTSGLYSFANLCPGTYTLVPTLYCEQFNPPSRVIQVGPNLTQVNFSAFTNDVFTISGRVTTNAVDGLPGVSVTDGTQTVLTDANGNYLLTHVCPGPVSVVPSLDGYGFNPGASNLTIVANMAGVNFVSFPAFEISGVVNESVSGQLNPLPGITLKISNAGQDLGNVMTDVNGRYEIRGLTASTNAYIITPLDHCWLFQPTNLSVYIGPSTNNQNFTATHDNVHTISGTISDGGGGLGNILVQATFGGLTLSTTTDPNGNYSFAGLCSQVYTLTPTQSCSAFFPPSQTVTLTPGGQDPKAVNFSSYPNTFTVRGTITNTAGGGVSGVTVTGGGLSSTTDPTGNYILTPLCPGNIIVTPQLDGYGFMPPTLNLTVTADLNGMNFTALPVFSIHLDTNGLPQLTFVAAPGPNYQIEGSADLLSWQTIFTTNVAGLTNPVTIHFTDPAWTNYSARFYRLRQ